jgi:hypothetical protein
MFRGQPPDYPACHFAAAVIQVAVAVVVRRAAATIPAQVSSGSPLQRI